MIDPQDPRADSQTAANCLRIILDRAFGFVGVLDASGKLLEINAAALAFAGVSRAQVVGCAFAATPWWNWSAEQQAKLTAGIASASHNEFVRFEAQHRRADGSIEPVDFSLSPVLDQSGTVTHLVAEGRRNGQREQLERELRARAEELEAAKMAADKANLSKSEFLAAASHDLRQPLQTIALVHAILVRTVKDQTAASQLHSLAEAIRSMENLLSALLDVNRLESGVIAPRKQVFVLEQILTPLRSGLGFAADDKQLQLDIPVCHESVRTDPHLLDVILRNLVSNAIKYTRRGSVTVLAAPVDGVLRIQVIDTGIGIAAEHCERLFDDFYQIDNPARDQRRGVGLGLGIVRRISRLLALPVRVQSEPGRGTTFSIDIPRVVSAVEHPAAANITDTGRHRTLQARRDLTILHIEDDPAVAASMRLLLDLEGYTVGQAASGDEALQLVRDGGLRPDVIITDYLLPHGTTGDEIVLAIADLLGRKPPTIMLTGDLSKDRRRTLERVVDRVLEKPADIETLLDAIETPCLMAGSGTRKSPQQRDSVDVIGP
ncbi:MAG: response regulator [Pseudomonadales bacterium]|nr:response regulator [Pseudomonadales bacterium]